MSPSGIPPENVDQASLQAVLADVNNALGKLCQGRSRHSTTVPFRAATLVGNLRAFNRNLAEFTPGPPPATLRRQELCPPARPSRTAVDTSSTSVEQSGASEAHAEEVLAEVVGLFATLADLETDAEWKDVSELDATETPPEGSAVSWEFDAVIHRNKRQALLEKADADRKAKRLKQQAQSQRTSEREVREDRLALVKKDPPARTDKAPARQESGKDRPSTETALAKVGAADAPPAAAKEPPAPPPAAGEDAKALANFVKDHPHMMRVLQNPKKSFGDPRVKKMFLETIDAYPGVKVFLEKKGLSFT